MMPPEHQVENKRMYAFSFPAAWTMSKSHLTGLHVSGKIFRDAVAEQQNLCHREYYLPTVLENTICKSR